MSGRASILAAALLVAASTCLVQVHHEITDHFLVQAGVGVRFVPEDALPEAGARAIYTF